ncbi:MAG: hypothetical protein ACRDTP_02040 [Mycobacteriales bacterium]
MKRQPQVLACVGAAVGVLAACGSSGTSQADFVKQANAVCTSVDTRVKTIPPPNENDLRSIASYASSTEQAYQSYLSQVTTLAAGAQDKKEIQASWITPATEDFRAEKPLLDGLVAAAKTGDATKIAAAVRSLQNVTDHTSSIQAFQKKYGATQCSHLLDDIGS